MGMGHWLLWTALGLIVILSFINLVGWMRLKKQQTFDNTKNGAQTIMHATDKSTANSSDTRQASQHVYHDISKHQGWGFWRWSFLSLLVLAGLAGLVWKFSLAPGATAFQWILWTLLPIAGLISLLGIAQMTRRHPLVDEKKGRPRGLGFLTLLSGLVLGLASWFIWQPQTTGLSSMRNDISDLKSRSEGLASKLSSRNTIIARLRGDAKKEALRYADLEKDMNASTATNEGEIGRLNGIIKNLKTQVSASQSEGGKISQLTARANSLRVEKENLETENSRMSGLVGTYKNDSAVQTAKIQALKAELETLRNKPGTPVTRSVVTKRQDTPLAMMHKYNQDETKLRLTSGDYTVVRMANIGLVGGKKGRYYNITLQNPANGTTYKFASASYSKIANIRQFKQSLDRAITDIKGSFEGKRNFQIYVKGKASAEGYAGKRLDGDNYSRIEVLPQNADGSWSGQTVERQYPAKILNEHLPNLRSAFLQDYISKNYKVTKPLILEGKISKSNEASNRTVGLILFVED